MPRVSDNGPSGQASDVPQSYVTGPLRSTANSPPAPHGGSMDPNFYVAPANSQPMSTPSLPAGQTSHAPHGGSTDPNEIRRRMVANAQTLNPVAASAPHGGSTDPNEIRRRMVANAQTLNPVAASAPHGGNFDPNEDYRQMANAQTLNPVAASASHGGNFDPNKDHRQMTHGQHSPSPSSPASYGQEMTLIQSAGHSPPRQQPPQSPYVPQQSYFQSGGTLPHGPQQSSPPESIPMMRVPSQLPNFHSNAAPASSQTTPVNRTRASDPAPDGPAAHHPRNGSDAERGYFNSFHERASWRIKWPNSFQLAGIQHPGTESRHRDIMQRAEMFPPGDYYLSPVDGHLAKLHVQCTQEIYDANSTSTWRRTFIRNQSPYILRAANWVLRAIPKDREATGTDLMLMCLRWIPSCVAILFLMTYPIGLAGEIRNGGYYDVFPYRFWKYLYHARNIKEDKDAALGQSRNQLMVASSPDPIDQRDLVPMSLCFLLEAGGIVIRNVSDWTQEHEMTPKYVFVSYTSEQFHSDEEKLFLHEVGEHAARAAGVPAYWVGCSNLGEGIQLVNNVWRLSDIIRGAYRVVIVVSNSINSGAKYCTDDLVKQWGTRVWTLPEVLLCSNDHPILVYSRDGDMERPLHILKRQFAAVWADAPMSRELIDHFEGSLVLTPIELISIAIRCFYNRQRGEYLPGDMSYALRGLLRRRPKVVSTDTAFQAFARLSLANDSNLLLERMICILPQSPNQEWYKMEDMWNANLWDIYPTTQICGIGKGNTVVIDGAYAANIRWKGFANVASLVKDSWRRFFLDYGFRCSSYFFIIGISLISQGLAESSVYRNNGYSVPPGVLGRIGLGGFLLTISLILIFLSPYLIRILYTGKIWDTQPWFFGFEGYLDIETIEEHIFGADMGYLKWSTAGSPLSVHKENEYGECIGQDPTCIPATAERVRRAVHAKVGEERIFTLVDTFNLHVTMFAATKPPVAVVICAEEGGMQRALLCSYDWSTSTLYRESVIRLETVTKDRMSRIGRFNFGFRRDEEVVQNGK